MDRYKKAEGESAYWMNNAIDLKASAGIIWLSMKQEHLPENNSLGFGKNFNFNIACSNTYLMLCGLSLELLFKSILIIKNKDLKKTHDLYELASLVGLNYSDKDIKILNILTQYIYRSGKYPIPRDEETFKNFNDLSIDYFFEKIKVSNIEIYHPKNEFTWESFNSLWKIAKDHYFTLKEVKF